MFPVCCTCQIDELKISQIRTDFYCYIRKLDRHKELYLSLSAVQRAPRMVYLNHTSYSGLITLDSSILWTAQCSLFISEWNTDKYNILMNLIIRFLHYFLIFIFMADISANVPVRPKGSSTACLLLKHAPEDPWVENIFYF